MPIRQARYWILTWSCTLHPEQPVLTVPVVYLKGQQEIGEDGYRHWQFIIITNPKTSLRIVSRCYHGAHCEPSRSDAAEAYVWKENSRVHGSQFELGTKPFHRNQAVDWDLIWESAKSGDLGSIPSNVRVQNYRTIRQIATDFAKPTAIQRTCWVFIGPTGTGKSRRAWDEAGLGAYPKDPRSKFWCGYTGQESVIIDEFRGGIDISHLLRWLDRYPVIVEIKGGGVCLSASTLWITTNMPIACWYPGLDTPTFDALLRRVNIIEFQ